METVNTADAASRLARPGLTPDQARGWLHRAVAAGVLPPLGKQGAKGTWAFDRRTVIIAAVLRSLHEQARVRDAAALRAAYTLLAGPNDLADANGQTLIDAVLADIEGGGLPVLCVTYWQRPADGAICTAFAVRLGSEYQRPLVAPADDLEPLWHGVLELTPLLRRFIGNADNVVQLRGER